MTIRDDLGTNAVDDEPDDVVRLAMVMNGGVSLAVWMGGVTHELDRALDRSGTGSSPAWRAILDAQTQHGPPRGRRRLVVDYVAGTSAGGLNGALMATAIARGAQLPDLRSMWVDDGQLQEHRLLPKAGSGGRSVLDGDFFGKAINEQLTRIGPGTASAAQPVSLLVTATAMTEAKEKPPEKVEDAQRHPFEFTDHRRVYLFATADRDEQEQDRFTPAEQAALALAARASASFPGAFVPVLELPELRARRWPEVKPAAKGDAVDPSWLIDGGVLDNAPFGPLLDEITRRPRADPGDRWIVYVVPTARGIITHPQPPTETAVAPDWVDVVQQLWSLKSEVDLRSDVETLRRLQEATRAVSWRPEDILVDRARKLPPVLELLPMYQRTRAVGFVQYLSELYAASEKFKRLDVDPRVRELLDPPRALPAFIPDSLSPTRDGVWQWGVVVAQRLALWMSRSARKTRAQPAVLGTLADLENALTKLRRQLDGIYCDHGTAQTHAKNVIDETAALTAPLFAEVTRLLLEAVPQWEEAVHLPDGEGWSRLLSTEILLNFAEWHVHEAPPEVDVMLIGPGDPSVGAFVFPGDSELIKDLQDRPGDKLYGTRLGHFGAFGQRTYREHDWLWGRLDGGLGLARALLTGVDEEVRRGLRTKLVEEILDEASRIALADATRTLMHTGNVRLSAEVLLSGEVDTGLLADSLNEALDRVGRHLPFDDMAEKLWQHVGDSLHTAAVKVHGMVERVGHGLQQAAVKILHLFTRR